MEHSNSQNNTFIHLVNKLLEDSFINLPKTALKKTKQNKKKP